MILAKRATEYKEVNLQGYSGLSDLIEKLGADLTKVIKTVGEVAPPIIEATRPQVMYPYPSVTYPAPTYPQPYVAPVTPPAEDTLKRYMPILVIGGLAIAALIVLKR